MYVNTCGTFGVGSAAFWWGRLAGTLQRVIWELIPFTECIYMLLYADDGLILAAGENYQPNLVEGVGSHRHSLGHLFHGPNVVEA